MGKQRRQRRKLHKSSNTKPQDKEKCELMDTSQPINFEVPKNLFSGINIKVDNLNNGIFDDTRSIKSLKSLKSEFGSNKALSKKDKTKLRREMLLKKIDTVKQLRIENSQRRKRKHVAVIGNTNPLHDALPTLESLLSNKSSNKSNNLSHKRKGTEKAKKRKKQVVEGVQIFKKLMSNKKFQENPFGVISEHIKNVVKQQNIKNK